MKTENAVLMKQARESLAGKWLLAVQLTLIIVVVAIASYAIPFLPLVTFGPLTFSAMYVFLMIARGQTPALGDALVGFKSLVRNFTAYLLVTIFTTLWMLLLIVPGIIAAFAYGLTFPILVDDPSISALDAIKKSKKMMRGNKWKLFCLVLGFVGWMILALFTFGIGYLWLLPYMSTSYVKFYEDVKANYQEAVSPQSEEAVK